MSDATKPAHLVEMTLGKTDIELAADYRAELRPLLELVCAIMENARKRGLKIGFNIAPDLYGRQVVQFIDVTRPL